MESGEWQMDTEYWYVQYQRTSYGIRSYVRTTDHACSIPPPIRAGAHTSATLSVTYWTLAFREEMPRTAFSRPRMDTSKACHRARDERRGFVLRPVGERHKHHHYTFYVC